MIEIVAVMAFGWLVGEVVRQAAVLGLAELRWQRQERVIRAWAARPFQARRISRFEKAMLSMAEAVSAFSKVFAATEPVDERRIRRSDKAW